MSEHGHPPLDDRERDLLAYLAIRTICAQTGDSEQAIADVLDEMTGDGLVSIYRNSSDAYLTVRDGAGQDRVIVHAQRAWLHFAAHRADPAMN